MSNDLTNMRDVLLAIPGNMNVDFIHSLGDDNVFTIKTIERKELEFNGKKDTPPCLIFEETAKYLALSGTLSTALVNLFGKEIPKGKKVRVGLTPKGHKTLSVPAAGE